MKYEMKKAREIFTQYKFNLHRLLNKHSIKHGEFTLRSGKKSNFYIDCRSVLLDDMGLESAGMLVSTLAWMNYGADCFACTGVGGSYLASSSALFSGGNVIHIRDEEKNHGTKRKVELPTNFDNDFSNVVIVDDVFTTGSSLRYCYSTLREEAGINPVGAIVLVDREEDTDFRNLISITSIFTKSDF